MIINLKKEETKDLDNITKKIKDIFKDDNYDIKINPYKYEYNNKAVLDYHKKYYQENRERLIAYKREKDKQKRTEKLINEVERRERKVLEERDINPFRNYDYRIFKEDEEEFE